MKSPDLACKLRFTVEREQKNVKFWQTFSFSNLRRSCTPAASSSRPEPDGLRNRNDEDLGRAPAYPLQIELRRLLLSPELAPLTGKGDTESLENKEVNLAAKKIEEKMCVFFSSLDNRFCNKLVGAQRQ